MRFLIFGCNGMVGHMVSMYLQEQGYCVTGFAREKSLYVDTIVGDVRDIEYVRNLVERNDYDCIVNCIGILNKFAESDPEAAIFLNSYFPHYLEKITKNTEIQIIHISTDCVFSGNRGQYSENDIPDGELYYDRSKALGEIFNNKDVTFRTSVVGPDIKPSGIGLLNWFLQQNKTVLGYKNALWTGQTNLQLAKSIENAAIQRVYGLYNLVPERAISKYELLCLFNMHLRDSPVEIIPEYNFKIDKSLVRKRYEVFSYKIPDYEEQIVELKEWMIKHKEMYPHYENLKL